jgi:hypothetical protein
MADILGNELVPFLIRAPFIKQRVDLTLVELSYGVSSRWLDAADINAVMDSPLVDSSDHGEIDDLRRLSWDEPFRRDLVELLTRIPTRIGAPAHVWMFLSLAWIHDRRGKYTDAFGRVEHVCANFDEPPETWSFMRYMPAAAGEPEGLHAVDARWNRCLTRMGTYYRGRAGGMSASLRGEGLLREGRRRWRLRGRCQRQ